MLCHVSGFWQALRLRTKFTEEQLVEVDAF